MTRVIDPRLEPANVAGEADGADLKALTGRLADEATRREALQTLFTSDDRGLWDAVLRFAAHAARHRDHRRPAFRQEANLQEALYTVIDAFLAPAGSACDPARRGALLGGLTSVDLSIRALAAELLGQRAEDGALDRLVPLLADREDRVRAAAVRSIAHLAPERALPYLLDALEEYDVVAAEAVHALIELGGAAVPRLIEELRTGRAWTRWHAAHALGGIADQRAVGPLLAALEDDDASVRWQAALALSRIGRPVLDPLLRALSTGAYTRWFAEGADRVLRRVAIGPLYRHVRELRGVLHHLDAAIEAPVAAARARAALRLADQSPAAGERGSP